MWRKDPEHVELLEKSPLLSLNCLCVAVVYLYLFTSGWSLSVRESLQSSGGWSHYNSVVPWTPPSCRPLTELESTFPAALVVLSEESVSAGLLRSHWLIVPRQTNTNTTPGKCSHRRGNTCKSCSTYLTFLSLGFEGFAKIESCFTDFAFRNLKLFIVRLRVGRRSQRRAGTSENWRSRRVKLPAVCYLLVFSVRRHASIKCQENFKQQTIKQSRCDSGAFL